jgi:hypothetical protein
LRYPCFYRWEELKHPWVLVLRCPDSTDGTN